MKFNPTRNKNVISKAQNLSEDISYQAKNGGKLYPPPKSAARPL